ncbi:SUMF1/EgtB/PvdO family nonheme iron enzyme [Bythopirellula goksoeyrii]|uniref:Formylglycine-generating sulfatase enzyme n=1 Tax=Bythopirellula goksoeyrii TaxID=1400387 RepID=A0A5B9QCL0_9BACT|nr:SUMF1/EgtB/PvdO family nonheme iron enzyme [Bythopirellula goksoeyrii]QEG35360.1 Formylglycine-generating sulfatase enzyme [Bythopirellula goksoeyrii]
MKITTASTFLSLSFCFAISLHADSFGSGANEFVIEFVTIGDPGNPGDITGFPRLSGMVNHIYRIGKFEISEEMINKANALGGLGLTHDDRGSNKPATSISWFDAARFVNWLNTSTGNTPAYKFDANGNQQLWAVGDVGYDPNNLFRNRNARYFLPSVDEWHKAAYYDPKGEVYYDYATGSDTPPIPVARGTTEGTAVFFQNLSIGPADITQAGGLSVYGTMGQGGNVYEWLENEFGLANTSPSFARMRKGGAWINDFLRLEASTLQRSSPASESSSRGFRVASIPEPSTLVMGALAAGGLLVWRRRN